MKSEYKSAIRQMFLEGRGEINSLGLMPDSFRRIDSKLGDLEELFAIKSKKFPDLGNLHKQIVDELCADNSLECDYHYIEGFRFGVLLGLDIAGLIKDE